MSTEDQSREENLIYDIVFKHFRRHKIDIASAIKKEFPFLEVLRDREIITNKMYEDCQESCRNLVPVQRVVYNVLSQLEEKFDLPLLEALFSDINKQEYPELNNVYKSFENAIHEKLCQQESDEEETLENHNNHLSLGQGPGEHSYPSLSWNSPRPSNHNDVHGGFDYPPGCGAVIKAKPTSGQGNEIEDHRPLQTCLPARLLLLPAGYLTWETLARDCRVEAIEKPGTAPPENGLSEHLSETEQINVKRKGTTNDNNVPENQQANERCAQESEPAEFYEQVPMEGNNGDARGKTPSPLPHSEEVISSDDSTEFSDGDEPPEASTSAAAREPEPVDFRKSPICRKRLWENERSHEGFSGSSADEAPPRVWSPALRSDSDEEDFLDFGNQSTCEMSNKKRRISTEHSSKLSSEEEPQETFSSALRSWSDIMDIGKNSTLEKHSGKRREKRKHIDKINNFLKGKNRSTHRLQALSYRVSRIRSKPKGIKAVKTGPLKRCRKRVPRIPRDTNMDFRPPQLPVTCGRAKGILYKEIMKQGISAKCVEMEDGKQLTLKEFEIEGNHEKSKNWRLSVRCGGWPLKVLIQEGHLPDPPRTRKKMIPESHRDDFIDPYPENSNECEVCCKKGKLFCCDTCPRSFHNKCHICRIDPDRNPWSCIFCQIKAIPKNCPENQPCHQESEVLERQMLSEEKLKCEFLLLKVYSCPESPFFASKPYYSKQALQGLQKCMWLDKIRKKLIWKVYGQVKDFVQDMRLIFQNHRTFYRDHKFIRLGLQLEAKFEDNFKNVFAVQEISENSSQPEPVIA